MQFHLGDVLSVTTNHLVSRDHIDGVYKILNYMTGEDLFTHQLPRACDVCKPYIFEQHPALKNVVYDVPRGSTEKDVFTWLDNQIAVYGAFLELQPLPANVYETKNPIREFIDMREKN